MVYQKGVTGSENAWKVFIAPALASAALAAAVVLTVMHFELVVGGKPGQNLLAPLWDEPTGPRAMAAARTKGSSGIASAN